jgi:hypothetical protein
MKSIRTAVGGLTGIFCVGLRQSCVALTLQLRAGYRHYFGIPQNNEQNQPLTFFELHGYF